MPMKELTKNSSCIHVRLGMGAGWPYAYDIKVKPGKRDTGKAKNFCLF